MFDFGVGVSKVFGRYVFYIDTRAFKFDDAVVNINLFFKKKICANNGGKLLRENSKLLTR